MYSRFIVAKRSSALDSLTIVPCARGSSETSSWERQYAVRQLCWLRKSASWKKEMSASFVRSASSASPSRSPDTLSPKTDRYACRRSSENAPYLSLGKSSRWRRNFHSCRRLAFVMSAECWLDTFRSTVLLRLSPATVARRDRMTEVARSASTLRTSLPFGSATGAADGATAERRSLKLCSWYNSLIARSPLRSTFSRPTISTCAWLRCISTEPTIANS
mmetsp:Transcript_37810/g.104414  ORF Transcript_37810/g.104414 Transcript_37810/m.104414 type:complete len:219 (-) Transcript_37810:465-1121(-)